MTANLTLNSFENMAPRHINEISILLIDHDTTSIASLISMLKKFSYKVMNANMESEAISMMETEKDIGLVIANIEMPDIDSHSLLDVLIQKDIPLILIGSETEMTKKVSDFLMKKSCVYLKKPISENDIKNIWEHVAPKKTLEVEKIDLSGKQEDIVEAFRNSLKKQRISQASLLGRHRTFKKAFTTSETYQMRRTNVEPKNKSILYRSEVEDKTGKGKKREIHTARNGFIWNGERHMKFLAAISILGDIHAHPKAILSVMNDPNLSTSQVGSHLQKYKIQVDRISDTISKTKGKSATDEALAYSTDYKYPIKETDLTDNLISYSSLWHSLRKKKASSSSNNRYAFKKNKKVAEFQLGGILDVSNHPFFGYVPNNSPTKVSLVPLATSCNSPPLTHSLNHTGLVPTVPSATSNNPFPHIPCTNDLNHNGLVSTIPEQDANSSVEANRNPVDLEPNPIQDPQTMENNYNFPQDFTLEHLETIIEEMGWIPSTQNNMNQMGWGSPGESYVPSENRVSLETNTTQVDKVSCGTSHVALVNIVPPETNMEDMSLFPSGESYDVPIEDLISFDDDVNETDMLSWMENTIDHASASSAPMDSNPHNHSFDMHLGSTSQQSYPMEPSEYMNQGDNDDVVDDCMGWINQVLNEEA